MARRKTVKKDEKAKWQGFVNLYLTRTDKGKVKEAVMGYEDAVGFIEGLGGEGYKFSASYQPDQEVWTVSIFGQYTSCVNAGFAMSQRHVDFLTALSALYYAHVVMCESGPWDAVGGLRDESDW